VIAWSTIDAALVVAVKAATGLTDVFWAWQPSAMRKPQYIRLERSGLTALGQDERRHRREILDPVPDEPAFPDRALGRQKGQRTFSLELRCVSDVGKPSDTAPKDPTDILGEVQTQIVDPFVHDALHTAGVAVSIVGPIIRQTYSVEGREMRAAIMSLTLLATDYGTEREVDTIETVTTPTLTVTP
jgi:hypothetical protein